MHIQFTTYSSILIILYNKLRIEDIFKRNTLIIYQQLYRL